MKLDLFNEDCMQVMARYPDKYFDLAIVDPPYGLGEARIGKASRNRFSCNEYADKSWDNEKPSLQYFEELKRVSKNQVIWGANHFISAVPSADSSCWVVWDKENGGSNFADCELAYCSLKSAVRIFRYRWAGMLQGDMRKKELRIHPTQKPVKLYEWLLTNYSKPEHKILDTHLGSGSHAIAAYYFGIQEFVGCELDEEYFNAASERIERETAQLDIFSV